MSKESNTEILERKPLLKACLDYILKRIEVIIIAGAIGGCNHIERNQTEKWVGDHLSQKQHEIDDLERKQLQKPQ